MNYILDGFNEFSKENKAAKYVSGVLTDIKDAQTKVDSLNEMSAAIKAMPMYKEMLEKYSLHINLATTAMKEYEKRKLALVSSVEQDMSTGEDAEGKPIKNILSRISPVLQDETISVQDKMRLLMLYVISQEGVKDGDRKRLFDLAKITHRDQNIINNLKYLGVSVVKTGNNKKQKSKQTKKPKKDNPSYELSRYSPTIKKLAEEIFSGNLSKEDFPVLASKVGPRSPTFSSLRNGIQPKWLDKPKQNQKDEISPINLRKKGRLVIFIVGGATYSEIRTVYELAAQYNREVILGTTAILTPDEFITQVGELKKMDFLDDDFSVPSAL